MSQATQRASFVHRVRWIVYSILVLSCILVARLFFLQVVHGDEYRKLAESQYVKQSANRIDRGSIYFTSKEGSLISAATIASGYTVAINPKLIKKPKETLSEIQKILPDIDASAFLEKATKVNDSYEEVARRIPESKGKALLKADIDGVEALREEWRFYPGNALAAQTIGFLGYGADGTTVSGQYGLERYYNEALSRTGAGLNVNFFADLFTNLRSSMSGDVQPGANLKTSIEPSVQQFLEGLLSDYDGTWHAKTAGAIIMDPKTGAIVALASRPTFDLNNFKSSSIGTFSNPLVERTYEFGSTMKPLTMAAGIDAGVVTPQTTYNDKGFAEFDGKTISNFDHKGRGVVPMQEVLNQSLNTGVAFVVQRMGTTAFKEYFKKFGILDETGIDLPSEASPQTENFKSPRTLEYITASFGQGIALTPIAMTRSLATLANGGVVPGPHVGLQLQYGGGLNKTLGWAPPVQAISPQSAETVTRMLVTVVDTALQHGQAKIPEYSIAAKTGTAQIAETGARGYYTDRYLHSFFGYFPAYDPKFIVFLYAVEPVGAKYASETWTEPFMKTVKFLINYYDIPPDRAAHQQ